MRNRLILAGILFLSVFLPCSTHARVDADPARLYPLPAKPLDIAASVDGNHLFVLARGKVFIFDSRNGRLNDTIVVDPSMDRIAVSGLTAGGIEDKLFLSSTKTGKTQEFAISFSVVIDTEGAPYLGNPDAPVTIVEFSDFECPYCSKVGPLMAELLAKNPETVKVVFKHYPLSFHKNARRAALASLAAQRQGRFWEFHDQLFEHQKELTPATIRKIAQQLSLDLDRFEKDLADPALAARVDKDIRDGKLAGVRGTPTLFVNGRRVKNRSVEAIQKMINQELSKNDSARGKP